MTAITSDGRTVTQNHVVTTTTSTTPATSSGISRFKSAYP